MKRALPGLLFALLVLGAYSPVLFGRRNFAGRDLLVYHLPIEKAIHDAWEGGRLPVWVSEISGGRPLLPNPNAGALYPVRPILATLPFPLAMRLFPIIHWIAAGLGMIVLLRSIGTSRAAAWVGAVTYAFSGVAVTESFFPNIQPGMTLLPWVLWAVQRKSGRPVTRLSVLSLLLALLLVAGDVFTTGMAVTASILWIIVERERQKRLPELLFFVLSGLLAVLLAAPQIVASALWVLETNRAILGMKLGESLMFSLNPIRLVEFVVPYPFGPAWSLENSRIWGWPVYEAKTIGFFTTLYAGAFPIIALAASRKWRSPGVRFARILFLGGLVVSVGPSFLPSAWAGWPSPLPLRYPEKFAVVLVLALAIFAGIALDRFRASPASPRRALSVAAFLAVLAAAAALFPRPVASVAVKLVGAPIAHERLPEAPTQLQALAAREIPAALAEAGLLWIVTVVALDLLRRPRRMALCVSLGLLTAVPLVANQRIARTVVEEELVSPPAFARFLHRADPAGQYRTLGEAFYRDVSPAEIELVATDHEGGGLGWVQYRQVLMGRGTVFNHDFDAGDFARFESLRRISLFVTRRDEARLFFGNLSLRWGIRFRGQEPVRGYQAFRSNRIQTWDELPGALPDIRLVENWREVSGPLEAANVVARLPAGEVVLETDTRRHGRAGPGTVRVLEREADRLLMVTEAPSATWLFVLRGFWNHRTVRVDGRPVEVVPAQLAFSAIPVPAGRHTIDWREDVPGSDVSRWGPLLAVLLAAGLYMRDRRAQRAA